MSRDGKSIFTGVSAIHRRFDLTPNGFRPGPEVRINGQVARVVSDSLALVSRPKSNPKWFLVDVFKANAPEIPLPDRDIREQMDSAVARSDGKLFAYQNDKGKVTLLNLTATANRTIATLPEPDSHPREISPDGHWLLVSSYAPADAYLYDLRTPQPKRSPLQLAHVKDTLSAACFSADSRSVFMWYRTGRICRQEIETGNVVWETKMPSPSGRMMLAHDNRHLFLHNLNGTVYVLRLPDPSR